MHTVSKYYFAGLNFADVATVALLKLFTGQILQNVASSYR